jgi:hypothetical protein
MQEARRALVALQQACEGERSALQSVEDSCDEAKTHLDNNGHPGRKLGSSAHQISPARENLLEKDSERMNADHGRVQSEYMEALNSFRKAQRSLRACIKKQAETEEFKGRGGIGKTRAEERQETGSRRDALNRAQAHMQMLEDACQVHTQRVSP